MRLPGTVVEEWQFCECDSERKRENRTSLRVARDRLGATEIPWGVRGRLPIFLAIFPLLVTVAIVFECFPEFVPQRFQLLFLLLAMVAGWIGVGVSSFPRRWLKVLALILYPFLMMALLFLAVVRHLPIL